MVKHVCRVHGVDLDAVQLISEDSEASNVPAFEDQDDTDIEAYGWPELQIGIVREAVAVAEALPGQHVRDVFRSAMHELCVP